MENLLTFPDFLHLILADQYWDDECDWIYFTDIIIFLHNSSQANNSLSQESKIRQYKFAKKNWWFKKNKT